jgi:hypothetical protein
LTPTEKLEGARQSILKVGDGRGFVIDNPQGGTNLVITAAHCLPHLPPCCSFSHLEEKTYRDLLGVLGDAKPKIWAECLFVDPIADIAVLGSPDDQELFDRANDYEALTEGKELTLGEVAADAPLWVLRLDDNWLEVVGKPTSVALWIQAGHDAIQPGMSGSPILTAKGVAVGVVSAACNSDQHGPQPALRYKLPGWLVSLVSTGSKRSEQKRSRQKI